MTTSALTGVTATEPGRSTVAVPPTTSPGSIHQLLTGGLRPLDQGRIARQLDALGTMGANVAQDVGGWAARVRDALGSLPSSAANALADSMRGSQARELTPGETVALRRAFGDSIDLGNVRIVNGPGRNPDAALAFNVGGNPAITEGNTVYVRSDHYTADFSTSPAAINTLTHEFTHVRQYQQLGFGGFFAKYAGDLVSIGDRNKVYDYNSRGGNFGAETIEGQAQMVGDYAGYKAGEVKLSPAQVASVERKLAGTGLFGL